MEGSRDHRRPGYLPVGEGPGGSRGVRACGEVALELRTGVRGRRVSKEARRCGSWPYLWFLLWESFHARRPGFCRSQTLVISPRQPHEGCAGERVLTRSGEDRL